MNGYNWLRDGLIPGCSAFLEALWLYAWFTFGPSFYNFIVPGSYLSSPHWGLAWIFILIGVPAVAGRWLEYRFPQRFGLRQWLLWALIVVVFAGFIKFEGIPDRGLFEWQWLVDVVFPWAGVEPAKALGLLGFSWVAGLVFVARGVWLALSDIDEQSATRWFLIGLGAFLVLLGIMLAWTWGIDVQLGLGALLGVYFCLGLAWLGLIRQQTIEERVYGHSSRLRWSWLALFGSVSAAIFGIGVGLSALQGYALYAATQIATGSAPVAGGLWLLLGQLELAITRMWVALFLFLLRLIPASWWERLGRGDSGGSTPQVPEVDIQQWPLPPHIQESVGAVVLLLCVWWLVRRLRHIRLISPGSDDVQTSVWSWDLLKEQVSDLIPGRKRRRQRSTAKVGPVEDERAHAIRMLYRQVLRWAREDQHRPRELAATPHEFQDDLAQVLPDGLVTELTAAYVHVRYADGPLEEVVSERLRVAFEAGRAAVPTPQTDGR